jgi:hypothetical protein
LNDCTEERALISGYFKERELFLKSMKEVQHLKDEELKGKIEYY